MPGPRIRTIKPEWLEDEQLLRAGSHARVLSVALILVADDYGRGRCIPEALAAQVFPFEQEASRIFRESLARLSAMQFVGVYRVREQQYFQLRNWSKHQRVDKPGKPRVPAPNGSNYVEIETSGEARAVVASDSGDSRETLAPDLDLDLDLDREQESRGHACDPSAPCTAVRYGHDGPTAAALKSKISSKEVAAYWHRIGAARLPGLLHALEAWRDDYEIIGSACNLESNPRAALEALVRHFWLAPHGAVVSGRVKHPNPQQLARYVTRDMSEAFAWWQEQQAQQKLNGAREVGEVVR